MNKSLVTNLIAAILCAAAFFIPNCGEIVFSMGIFALSGAVTNWLAIYMLFEKVPFLYGSGIIPNKFEEFKVGIKELIVTEFFSSTHIKKFFQSENVIEGFLAKIDFDHVFLKLSEAIEGSSLGGVLAMVGGKKALEPLREPVVVKLKEVIADIAEEKVNPEEALKVLKSKIESLIDQRLDELTPQEIKQIVQKMIQEHLGWLVVWGGVFGGLIGLAVELIHLT